MRIALVLLIAGLAGCVASEPPEPPEETVGPDAPADQNPSPAQDTWPSSIDGTWTGTGGEWILVLQPLIPGNYAKEHDSEVDFVTSGGDDADFFFGPFLVIRDANNVTGFTWDGPSHFVYAQEDGPAMESGNSFAGSLDTPAGHEAIALGTLAAAKTPWTLTWNVDFNDTATSAGPLEVHRGTGATWFVERATNRNDPNPQGRQTVTWDLPAGVTLFAASPTCSIQSITAGGCVRHSASQQSFSMPGGVWDCEPPTFLAGQGYFGHPAGTHAMSATFAAPGDGYDYFVGHVPVPDEVLSVDLGHLNAQNAERDCRVDP